MKSSKIFPFLAVILLFGVLFACEESVLNEKEQIIPPSGALVGYTGCKTFKTGTTLDSISPNQSCIEYSYDGQGTLLLKHINALFNCCQDSIVADIDIRGDNLIIINESEYPQGGMCDCLCLFDLDLEVIHLIPGQYTIKVIEPYVDPDEEQLEFTITLSPEPSSGIYCVERDHGFMHH